MTTNGVKGVYLLHFEPRYKHAGHYLEYADDIGRRVYEHEFDQANCKLTSAATRAGCKIIVARVWAGGDRTFERKLKGGMNNKRTGSRARLCPICKGELPTYEQVHVASTQGVEQQPTCVEAGTSL